MHPGHDIQRADSVCVLEVGTGAPWLGCRIAIAVSYRLRMGNRLATMPSMAASGHRLYCLMNALSESGEWQAVACNSLCVQVGGDGPAKRARSAGHWFSHQRRTVILRMLCTQRAAAFARPLQRALVRPSVPSPGAVRALSGSGMIGEVQKKDELVQIVDENDTETRGARRQEMREEKLIHRCDVCGVDKSDSGC